MPQPISNSSNVAPRYTGTKRTGSVAQSNSSFADDKQFTLHGSLDFHILGVGAQIHPTDKFLDEVDAVAYIAEVGFRAIKRQVRPRGTPVRECVA